MNVSDYLTASHPRAEVRRRLPQESMMYWNSDCWHDWVSSSVRTFFSSRSGREATLAFAPLVVDPDLLDESSLYSLLRALLPSSALERFGDGLAKRLSSLQVDTEPNSIAFSISLGAHAEIALPATTFNRLTANMLDYGEPSSFDRVAIALALFVSRKSDHDMAYHLVAAAGELFRASPTSAVIIASIIAKHDHRDFIKVLRELYPDLFLHNEKSEVWAFTVDKLLEFCAPIRALEVAYSSDDDATRKFRLALHWHRIAIEPQGRWLDENSRTIYDQIKRSTSLIPAELLKEIFSRNSITLREAHLRSAEDSFFEQTDYNTHPDLISFEVDNSETITLN